MPSAPPPSLLTHPPTHSSIVHPRALTHIHRISPTHIPSRANDEATADFEAMSASLAEKQKELRAALAQLKQSEAARAAAAQAAQDAEMQVKALTATLKGREQELEVVGQRLQAAERPVVEGDRRVEALTQSLAAKEGELNDLNDRLMGMQEQAEEMGERLRRVHDEKVCVGGWGCGCVGVWECCVPVCMCVMRRR